MGYEGEEQRRKKREESLALLRSWPHGSQPGSCCIFSVKPLW